MLASRGAPGSGAVAGGIARTVGRSRPVNGYLSVGNLAENCKRQHLTWPKIHRRLLSQFLATNCRPSARRFDRPPMIEKSSGTRGPPSREFETAPVRHAISRRTTPACVFQELLGSPSGDPKSLGGGARPRNRPKRIFGCRPRRVMARAAASVWRGAQVSRVGGLRLLVGSRARNRFLES